MKHSQTCTDAFAKSCIIFSRDQICKWGFLHWMGNISSYSESFGSQISKSYFSSYAQKGVSDTCCHSCYHSPSLSRKSLFLTGHGSDFIPLPVVKRICQKTFFHILPEPKARVQSSVICKMNKNKLNGPT